MASLNQKMGVSVPGLQFGVPAPGIVGTTFALDSAFVNATSGDAIAMRFSSPVTQSSAAMSVYLYLTAKTGSPTSVSCGIWAGPSGVMDDDRPDTGAALATSAAVDVSAQTAPSWTTFSISSVSLTKGATYFLIVYNGTATQASNYPTYMTRGLTGNAFTSRFPALTTTDGFTTDPATVSSSADAPFVLAFADGTIVGCPYVKANTPTNNANDRGNRFTFDTNVTVAGVIHGLNSASLTAIKVYQGASEVASATLDKNALNNISAVYFDAPVTFSAGLAYDVVGKFSGNVTVGQRLDGDASPPADVAGAMTSVVSSVNGATPGSYTSTAGITNMFLLLDNIPASSGASSFAFLGN